MHIQTYFKVTGVLALGAGISCSSGSDHSSVTSGDNAVSNSGSNATAGQTTGSGGSSGTSGAVGVSGGTTGTAKGSTPDGTASGTSSPDDDAGVNGSAASGGAADSGGTVGSSGGSGNTAVGGDSGAGGDAGNTAIAGDSGIAPGNNSGDVAAPSGGTCGLSWTNQCKQGTHDPSIVKQGDTYYLFATGGLGFSTSKDTLTWTRGGNGLSGMPAWTQTLGLAGAPSIWAPDAHLVGGKALVYYAVSSWGDVTHSAVGLMTNTSFDPSAPGYKWVDQGKVVGSPEGGAGVNIIDPDLLVDDDGSLWLVYGSHHSGIRVIQLNPATGLAMSNPPNPVAVVTTKIGEGSSLIKANGYYYLFLSAGVCCDGLKSTYSVVYGRATKVTGPYLNRNGQDMSTNYETLLAAGQDGNPGQGGQSFFKDNGQWYMDYHAYQPPNGDSILNVRPVYFDATGWPTFDICQAKGYTK